ncbi:hypothetical protein GN956_G18991 [Arapaima gigas]
MYSLVWVVVNQLGMRNVVKIRRQRDRKQTSSVCRRIAAPTRPLTGKKQPPHSRKKPSCGPPTPPVPPCPRRSSFRDRSSRDPRRKA